MRNFTVFALAVEFRSVEVEFQARGQLLQVGHANRYRLLEEGRHVFSRNHLLHVLNATLLLAKGLWQTAHIIHLHCQVCVRGPDVCEVGNLESDVVGAPLLHIRGENRLVQIPVERLDHVVISLFFALVLHARLPKQLVAQLYLVDDIFDGVLV